MLRPSPTSYRAAGWIRCYRGDELVSIAATDAIELVLRRAAVGATASSLADAIVANDPELATADAEAFVAELVARGVLVADIARPPRAALPELAIDTAAWTALGEAIAVLGALDRGVEPLADFVVAFAERFGDEEVPLLVALDPEIGVGWPRARRAPVFDERDARLLSALASGAREIELAAADLPAPLLPLPAMYAARVADDLALAEVVACAPATDAELPLDDLALALDGDRLALRSRRLGREVSPPADIADAPPIARLLAALPHQGTAARLAFDWGPLATWPALPVVRVGAVRLWPPAEARSCVTFGRAVAPARRRRPALDVPRVFAPGTEWLHLKLYGADTCGDALLDELAAPSCDRAIAAGLADRWHFVRVAEPRPHLRVRVHGTPPRLHSELLAELAVVAEPLRGDGRLRAIEVGSYAREIARYGGGAGVVLAERIFHHDSEAVVALLRELDIDDDGEARRCLALFGIDRLLVDLGVDRDAVLRELQRGHFRIAPRDEPAFAARFAERRDELARLLASPRDVLSDAALAAIDRRARAIDPLVAELRELETSGRLSRTIAEQAPSYVHGFANRMFAVDALDEERQLYDLLRRTVSSSGTSR
jgi:thiopeptide-type bacteriocin biosynthesis protein